MKTKDSNETVRAILSMITKESTNKILGQKRTECAGEFRKLCKNEGIQINFTMNDTKAAFAEITKRYLTNILYRYMEKYGSNYFHKLLQIVKTLNSGKKCSMDLIPMNVSILYSKPLREFKKPSLRLEKDLASPSIT